MKQISIRKGREEDAKQAILVLRNSIRDLCYADHEGNTDKLSDWLANKTAESWYAWCRREDAVLLVAERADEITGVGMMSSEGEILLNYVASSRRFEGISKQMLLTLEEEAKNMGLSRCFLESTKTAQAFYQGCGYTPFGEYDLRFHKTLSAELDMR